LKEQGKICCYCMKRINKNNMKIEHWQCQSKYPHRQLDFNNMLAACKGCEGEPEKEQTCDTKKGDRDIVINPLDYAMMQDISYRSSGEICTDKYNNDIEVLNLNKGQLVRARETVIELARTYLGKKPGAWSPADIKKEINKWKSKGKDGEYPEFCGAVLFYLNKRLRKCSEKR